MIPSVRVPSASTCAAISGVPEAMRAMSTLRDKAFERVARTVFRSVTGVIQQRAISNLVSMGAIRSGLLSQAIKSKVKLLGSRKQPRRAVYGIVGPDSSVVGTHDGKKAVPWRYAHLVDGGTEHSRAKPFISDAARESVNEVRDAVVRGLNRALKAEERRDRKGKS